MKATRFFLLAACGLLFCSSPPDRVRAASQTTENTAQSAPATPPPTSPQPRQYPQNPPPETAPASPDFWTQDYLTGNWGGVRDDLKKHGVSFTPIWTGEVFGNPVGGRTRGITQDGLFDLLLDVDLDPLSGGAIKDTTFHAEAFYLYGNGLSASNVGDFSNTSNVAGYNTLRLSELWLQHAFLDNKLGVKVGNQAVDTEYFQSASASLFINGTFGAFTFLANNVPDAPVYPLASPGIRIQVTPDPHWYVMGGVYGLDNQSVANINNKNGTLFALDGRSGLLVMAEAGYLLNQGPNDKGLQGAYRIGSWLDTGNFTTFESQAAMANGTGNLQSAGPDYGVYGVVDQQVYGEGSRVISIFSRVGCAPTNTTFVDAYVDAGFNLTGFIPGRDKDVAGLGIARSHVSEDYSMLQTAQGAPPSSAETVLEATYKVQIAPWWNVQPDVQYVITPSGVVGSHDSLVLGVRTNVSF